MNIRKVINKLGLGKKETQADCIHLQLYGLDIKMGRLTNPDVPHEVTIVVPRAEVREKYDTQGRLTEKEIILNSITVVHSPRHPLAGDGVMVFKKGKRQ